MKLVDDQNQCTACSECFACVTAFDAHRTGEITDRRCLTVDEMEALGMRQKGGFWHADQVKDD
jgi:hypothetical protein